MNNILDNNGNYKFLPICIRDFHNQKELFKAIYADTNYYHLKIDDFYKIGWTQMHVNVIDVFLYNMARRGYCLKKDERFKEIGLYEFNKDTTSNNDHPIPLEKDKKEVAYIIKVRNMTEHISANSLAEVDIKVKCMNVIIDMLRERDK